MLGQAQRGEQRAELGLRDIGDDEPHVVLDAAPGQQPRLLKDDGEADRLRERDKSFETRVEPGR